MENGNLNQLGDKILELRRQKRISQESFAKKIGVSRQVVSKWESNLVQPKAEKLQLISEVFGIDVEFLMSEKMSVADLVVRDDNNENVVEDVCSEVLQDTSDKQENVRKKKLSKKTIKIIAVCVTLLLLGIALIIFDYATSPKMEEGDIEIIVIREWNFSTENIGWIFFGVATGLSVIWGTYFIFKIIIRKRLLKKLSTQKEVVEENTNKIGNKILALRKSKNLSQEEFANRVGVSRQAVSKWEANEVQPKSDKLHIICEVLGVGLEFLMPESCQEDVDNLTARDVIGDENLKDVSGKGEQKNYKKLSKKSKIKIAIVSTFYFIGIALIVFAYATAPPEMEGSFGSAVTSTSWNFSAENIGWILFSLAIVAGVILGIVLLCNAVKKRRKNKF